MKVFVEIETKLMFQIGNTNNADAGIKQKINSGTIQQIKQHF